MATNSGTLSITRPGNVGDVGANPAPLARIGIGLSAASLMALMIFFIISAVVAGWVSDLNGSDSGSQSLAGKIDSWWAWLSPVSVAALAAAKFGISVVLLAIVRTLWLRVESLKQSLPVLITAERRN